MTVTLHQVTETIDGAHPHFEEYPLLPLDLLRRNEDGTWTKECPGLMVSGFELTEEQEATLIEREFFVDGLNYDPA